MQMQALVRITVSQEELKIARIGKWVPRQQTCRTKHLILRTPQSRPKLLLHNSFTPTPLLYPMLPTHSLFIHSCSPSPLFTPLTSYLFLPYRTFSSSSTSPFLLVTILHLSLSLPPYLCLTSFLLLLIPN